MNAATLGIASDFVKTGIEKAGIPLSATLEAYLSLTFARFIGSSITVDLLTVRTAQAMDAGAPRDVIRAPGRRVPDRLRLLRAAAPAQRHRPALCRARPDELRRRRAHRAGLRLRAHARRDRLSAATDEAEDGAVLVDRARAGSQTARAELAQQNVVIGPWGGPPKAGLLWR